jgi:hypothetical protein
MKKGAPTRTRPLDEITKEGPCCYESDLNAANGNKASLMWGGGWIKTLKRLDEVPRSASGLTSHALSPRRWSSPLPTDDAPNIASLPLRSPHSGLRSRSSIKPNPPSTVLSFLTQLKFITATAPLALIPLHSSHDNHRHGHLPPSPLSDPGNRRLSEATCYRAFLCCPTSRGRC